MSSIRDIAAEISRQKRFTRMCALLEPAAIETVQLGTFTYNVTANDKRILLGSYNTQIGSGAGRMEARSMAQDPMDLIGGPSGISMIGNESASYGVILNQNLPVYGNPEALYYERMAALDSIQMQTLKLSNTATSGPLLFTDFIPGPYGAIIKQITCFSNTYALLQYTGQEGINVANELGDLTTQSQRYGNTYLIPVSRIMTSGFGAGAAETSPARTPYVSIAWQLLPRTWAKIPDPIQSIFTNYTFYDDFLAGLDTTINWNTPTQLSGGTVTALSSFGCLEILGAAATWGNAGINSKISRARSTQPTLVFDVVGSAQNSLTGSGYALIGGWGAGANASFTDLAHGVHFGTPSLSSVITIYENGTSRGNVGNGWTAGAPYRVKIQALSGGGATYGIQGGLPAEGYAAIGGQTFTNITPGTTVSVTNTLVPEFNGFNQQYYVNLVRTY